MDTLMKMLFFTPLMLLALAGCAKKSAPVSANTQAAVTSVRTELSTAIEAPLELALTGSFAAEFSAALATEAEGIVAETPVNIGDFVAAGAPVLVLRTDTARLRLAEADAREREAVALVAQAEARLGAGTGGKLENTPDVLAVKSMLDSAEAEQRLLEIEDKRAASLLATGDVSRSSHDRARANLAMALSRTANMRKQYEAAINQAKQSNSGVDAARAALQTAKSQTALARKALGDLTVRAPFAGFVSARSVSPGEFINNQSKFLTLDRLEPLKLEIQSPESNLGKLRTGLPVFASVQAYPSERFEGRITAISPAVNPASRSFLAQARFDNRDRRLKPGMFAGVTVSMGSAEKRTVIPAAALDVDNRTESNRVWVVENGIAKLRLVEVAARGGNQVQLRGGLAPGTAVIVGDRSKLFDGMPVVNNPNLR
jgi:RND family efflux transporter MFP subunit